MLVTLTLTQNSKKLSDPSIHVHVHKSKYVALYIFWYADLFDQFGPYFFDDSCYAEVWYN